MPQNNSAIIASKLLGESFLMEFSDYQKDDAEYCVMLTDELADHIVQMYDNTNWDNIDLIDVGLDDDIFSHEINVEILKSYVGKHILVSRYGDPWPEIKEAEAFVPGVRIDFSDRLMTLTTDSLSEATKCESIDVLRCFNDLSKAVCAMLMDGVPEDLIKNCFCLKLNQTWNEIHKNNSNNESA